MGDAPDRPGLSALFYRTALLLLPASLRREAGRAMESTFAEGWGAARNTGGWLGGLRYTMKEMADVVRTSVRVRLRRPARRGKQHPGGGLRGLSPLPSTSVEGVIGAIWMDLRVSARALLKRPAYLAVASLTLAGGIGANAAMFAVVNSVVLRPLAYPDADELVMVHYSLPRFGFERGPLSYHNFKALESRARGFSSIGAVASTQRTLVGQGHPRQIRGWRVSGDLFATLGVDAAVGRYLVPVDDDLRAPRVVVLSHALWVNAFGGDEGAVGTDVRLGGQRHTVVGVMPADFPPLGDEDQFWVPLALDSDEMERGSNLLQGIARLADGVDLREATADAATILADEARTWPEDADRAAVLTPRHEYVVGSVRHQLLLLMGAVGVVLLVACANVAGLSLTRGTQRAQELAVRTALGAPRGRLIRLLVSESLIVAGVGAALGAAVAVSLTRVVAGWGAAQLPRQELLSVDASALLFLTVAAGGCAVLFGVIPAFTAVRSQIGRTLKDGARTAPSHRPQALLAAAQVAMAAVLLVGAGLLGRSLALLQEEDPGFRPDGVLSAFFALPNGSPEEQIGFLDDLEGRLRFHPSVESVGVSWTLPFVPGEASTKAMRDDQLLAPRERTDLYVTPVTPGFFRAMGIAVLDGATVPGSHSADDPPVAVVNQALVDALWPGEDGVGRTFLRGGGDDPTPTRVVGVVENMRTTSLAEAAKPYAYVPFAQNVWADRAFVVVRTSGDPLVLISTLRSVVRELDPTVPIDRVATMSARIGDSLARPRLRTTLVGAFALLGALLAVLGVYGLMGLMVAGRTREIGVRMALGADRAVVRRDVVRQGLGVAAAGLAVGLIAAALFVRVVDAYLFGVDRTDPVTWVGVAVLLLSAALLALIPPARRASAVDPLVALRAE